MQLSSDTDHDSEFWGGVPRTMRRQAQDSRGGGRVSSPVHTIESAREIHRRVEQSLRQTLTSVLVDSSGDDVIVALDQVFEHTSPFWEALLALGSKAIVQTQVDQGLDLVTLAKGAQVFYPKPTGRVYLRAAVYLHSDAATLAQAGDFPALVNEGGFLARHSMLLTACLIAAENLNVSDAATEAVARALWEHWVSRVKTTGSDFRARVESLVEDAYLKAVADESECEDDGEPEIWNPKKAPSGGYA